MNKETRDALNKFSTMVIKPRRTGLTYTAHDIVKEFLSGTDSTTIGEQAEEKSSTIRFDLLSPEDRAKATEKIKAFDSIVKPLNLGKYYQKQEHDITLSEQEYKVFYEDAVRRVEAADYALAVQRELNI